MVYFSVMVYLPKLVNIYFGHAGLLWTFLHLPILHVWIQQVKYLSSRRRYLEEGVHGGKRSPYILSTKE